MINIERSALFPRLDVLIRSHTPVAMIASGTTYSINIVQRDLSTLTFSSLEPDS